MKPKGKGKKKSVIGYTWKSVCLRWRGGVDGELYFPINIWRSENHMKKPFIKARVTIEEIK